METKAIGEEVAMPDGSLFMVYDRGLIHLPPNGGEAEFFEITTKEEAKIHDIDVGPEGRLYMAWKPGKGKRSRIDIWNTERKAPEPSDITTEKEPVAIFWVTEEEKLWYVGKHWNGDELIIHEEERTVEQDVLWARRSNDGNAVVFWASSDDVDFDGALLWVMDTTSLDKKHMEPWEHENYSVFGAIEPDTVLAQPSLRHCGSGDLGQFYLLEPGGGVTPFLVSNCGRSGSIQGEKLLLTETYTQMDHIVRILDMIALNMHVLYYNETPRYPPPQWGVLELDVSGVENGQMTDLAPSPYCEYPHNHSLPW